MQAILSWSVFGFAALMLFSRPLIFLLYDAEFESRSTSSGYLFSETVLNSLVRLRIYRRQRNGDKVCVLLRAV